MATAPMPRAVLFDLDGTLIDSAPDLLAALDQVLAGLGQSGADHARLRSHVSRGAVGLLAAGMPGWNALSEGARERARRELLDYYAEHCWVHSAPFEGIEALLGDLRARGLRMGVVTNKVSRFADPIVDRAGWGDHFGCLISGDRVDHPKPDPESVLAACRELGVEPARTLFVGDDRRDVLAGRAAGAATVVAAWGYLPEDVRPRDWCADAVIAHPRELIDLLDSRETG
ncbi:HAD-IA family hydrolase [Wenzhouxiangella sp. EGI_FJ10409]|uniref:HAD-IA family hydrolase n=1 Tax=Wenzhouxiangella sp. EGI_FJ10409 TaxID=3243767 RepID=UPI0035DF2CFB